MTEPDRWGKDRLEEGVFICRDRLLALLWRGLTLAACCCGLYPMFFGAPFSRLMLCYFTTQSNILVAILFAILAAGSLIQLLGEGRRGPVYHIRPGLQLAVVFFIQITFLVYASMLSTSLFSMGRGMGIANILLHYGTPLLALGDWLLFMPHGQVKYKHAGLWLVYPAAYLAFAFIRAELGPPFFDGSRYPYFFMDADALGWNLLWIGPLFFLGYLDLGCLLVWIDKAIARWKGRTSINGA